MALQRFTGCELVAEFLTTDHVTWSLVELIEDQAVTNNKHDQSLQSAGGQRMLMSGDHFSDFINHTLRWVMNAPRSSVPGHLAGTNTYSHWSDLEESHLPCCVCMAALCIICVTLPWFLSDAENSVFCAVMTSFPAPSCIHRAVFIIIKRPSKKLKNYTKWALCNCSERWYALDINSSLDSVVNHSTQKCNAVWISMYTEHYCVDESCLDDVTGV